MKTVGKVQARTELVSPVKAREWRAIHEYERQRPINENHVSRLAYEMKAGRFMPGTPVYFGVLPDGHKRLLNGNHTLEALGKYADGNGEPLLLTIIENQVADEDELHHLYSIFDIQMTRSWSARMKALGVTDDIPDASKVTSALGTILSGFATDYNLPICKSASDRATLMDKYKEAAILFGDCLKNGDSHVTRLLRRQQVMAVALHTLRYQPSFGEGFWLLTAQDNGLKVGHPGRALIKWLEKNSGRSAQPGGIGCKAASIAWNAYFKSRDLEVIRAQSGPLHILGTSWHKGRPDKWPA